MAAAQSGKISQLLKRGFIEIPDVMAGLALGSLGIVFAVLGVRKNMNKEIEKPFKLNYIVVRDDDPNADVYKRFHENPIM